MPRSPRCWPRSATRGCPPRRPRRSTSANRPRRPRPGGTWATSDSRRCCASRRPPWWAGSSRTAGSSGRSCPRKRWPGAWPRTTSSASPSAMSTAVCSARSPSMTCWTGSCLRAGERGRQMRMLPLVILPGDRSDLNSPRGRGPRAGGRYGSDAFGRLSETTARFMGTGRFLVGQSAFVVVWIALNTAGFIGHWDPYPFILLNLAFSTQAAYAAPLILLAQNRQDDRDRASIERDREVAARTQADTEFLARELAAVRLALSGVVTVDDLGDRMGALEKLISDRLPGRPPANSIS